MPIMRNPTSHQQGWTLVELMIATAVLTMLAAIAIPAYNNFIREGHFTSMRTTINGMRTSIEDFRLENGDYGGVNTHAGVAAITAQFGYTPSGDTSAYSYTVAVTSTNSYDVWGAFSAEIWVRCENRYSTCCDADTSSNTTPNASC